MAGLLNWLGTQARGAAAQINPWDNGATYTSVLEEAERKRKQGQPKQQAQPQQRPQAPQLGVGSLGNTGNNFSNPLGVPNVGQQQQQLRQDAVAAGLNANTELNKKRQADNPNFFEYLNPFGKDGLFGAEQQKNFTKAIAPVTEKLEDVQKNIDKNDKEAGFQWDSGGDYGRFAAKLLPGMAQGIVEAPTKVGEAVSGQRVRNGVTENTNGLQRTGALTDAVISTAGLGVGGSATLLKSVATGVAKNSGNSLIRTAAKIAKDAGTEALEETVQTFANDLEDDSKINTSFNDYAQSAAMGALGGSMMSGAGTTINYAKTIPSKVEAVAHENLVATNPNYAGLNQKLATTQNTLERTVIEQQMAGLRKRNNEAGFAEVPYGVDPEPHITNLYNEEIASYSSPQEFIDKTVNDLWERNKKGQGTDTWLTEDDAGSGYNARNTMSNNSPFYQKFYETYGHKPTKQALQDMVEQDLGVKQGGDYDPRILRDTQETAPYNADVFRELADREAGLNRQVNEVQTLEPKPRVEIVYRSEAPDRYGIGQAELGDGLYTGSKEIAGRKADGSVNTDGLHEYKVSPEAKILDSSSDEFKSFDSQASTHPSLKEDGISETEWRKRKTALLGQLVREAGYDGVKRGTNQVVAMSDKALIPVSKDAPIYRNKADKPPVAKTDPQASLKQEARKYKSAEEFVKAQGEPVYHRSQNKFDKFDISKVSNDSNRQRYGWGLYFSDTIPHDQYGKNLYEARLPKGTFIDSKQPVDEKIVNRIVEAVKANNKNPSELDEFSYSGYLFYKTLSRILGGDKEASLFLSKNGIDGLKSNIGKNANDYILFNDKSIKTKQELTSLYNEAHSGKAMSVEPNAPVAKTDPGTSNTRVNKALDPNEKLQYKNLTALEQRLYKEVKASDRANQSASQPVEPIASTVPKELATSPETEAKSQLPQETKSTQKERSLQSSKKASQTTERAPARSTDTSVPKSQKATREKSYTDDTPESRAKQATYKFEDVYDKHLGHKQGLDTTTGTKQIKDNLLRRGTNKTADGLLKMSNSENKAARAVPRMLQYIYKNAGQDPRVIEAAKRFGGEGTYNDAALVRFGEKAYEFIPDETSRARVHAVLDPEGSVGTKYSGMNMKKLTSNERKATAMLRDMGEAINDESYRLGEISENKWESNRGGKYIARMYKDIETSKDLASEMGITDNDAKALFKGMYKNRVEINNELRKQMIRDPAKLAVIRARQVRENAALVEYVRTAEEAGYVTDTPKAGYVKIPLDTAKNGKMYMNNWGGKYMRRDVYENINGYTSSNEAVRTLNDLLDLYDGNPARRLRKKMLTVYNPIVRTGNITSNYLFAYLNGINPATFTKNKVWAKQQLGNSWYPGQPKSELKGTDPIFIEAQKSGLIGNDIVRTDRNMLNAAKEFGREIETKSGAASLTTKALRGADIVTQRYGQADDISKLSAVKTWVDRGYSVKDAIAKTERGFQDYGRVGHMYDLGAKSPLFGNAFIRFQGDLWAGILRNAAIDHPIRLAMLPVATYALGQTLSGLSGESEEDKKTRETRVGAPKIPFTSISTEFQTPWGAVDASRFLGIYSREDLDGNSFVDEISRMLPFNVFDPTKLNTEAGRTDAMQKAASDPLIGPLMSMMFDVDWRGKSISDPDGVRNGQKLFPEDELSKEEKWLNRAQYTARQYMPYPYKEGEDIYSALTERKRNEQSAPGGKNDPANPDATLMARQGYNSDGSKKNVGQAVSRLFGVRTEQFGAEEAKNARERKEMFNFFDKTDKFKDSLDSETRKRFDSRHKSTATRDGIQKDFVDDPFYKYRNASELRDDKLFEAEKQYATMQNKFDGKPIDPIYSLPKDQRLLLLWKNSLPPGAKDDSVSAMYDENWYQDYRVKQDKYFTEKKGYSKAKGFEEHKDTNPYPETSKELQQAVDQYYSLSAGQRTGWRNNNPGAYEAMKNQWALQDEWKNKEREALGLGPLDDDKYGSKKGSSSGAKGGKRRSGGGKGGGSKVSANMDDYLAALKASQKLKITGAKKFSGGSSPVKAGAAKKVGLSNYRVVKTADGKKKYVKITGPRRVA